MNFAGAFLAGLRRIEVAVAVTAFAIVAASLLGDVMGRDLFGHGIYWASGLATFCTTIAGMLGFTLVVASGGHFRVSFVDKLFPASMDETMKRVADLVSMAICLWIAYESYLYVHQSFLIGMRGVSIDIPTWPIQAIIPYVFASAGVRYLLYALFPPLRPVPKDGTV